MIKINKEDVIKHNQHILAVSGGNFGIIDPSNLGFSVDAVNNEQDPLNQASNFLYYMGAGHTFENGNKRTAFEVAKGILASGSIVLDAPQNEVIGFVTGSVAQGKATRGDVRTWLDSYSRPIEEKKDFNVVTSQNIEEDKELLKKMD